MIAKKSLGQYFLRCGWVTDALIKAGEVTQKDTVLEIGPGTGILTRPLAAAAGKVVAVEKDEHIAETTAKMLTQEGIRNIHVMPGDILHLLPNLPHYDKIVANIPYYLTGRLFRLIFDAPRLPHIIVLTIQKEVAERITAKPPHMNLLALAVQAFGRPEIMKIVPAVCFSPRPKIDSAIIRISDISDDFLIKHHIAKDDFFALARAAFGHRRKMLVNTLAAYGDKSKLSHILEQIGLSPRARPEELSLLNWLDIMKMLS